MYALNAILIGCEEFVLPHVRRELGNCSVRIEAECSDLGSAVDVLRRSQGAKRLLILHVGSPRELDPLSKLTISFPGWPVVALMGGDEHPNGFRGDGITSIMRAGASQIVSLPLKPADFKAALDRIELQFVYSVKDSKVIAVAGGTRGSGATTIAINFAYEIAHQHGLRCILADLSLGMGVVASYLNIAPTHTIIDLLRDGDRLDTTLAQSALIKISENFEILAGPHHFVPPTNITSQDVTRVVDTLKQIADVVVLDVPCNYDHIYFETLAGATRAILIGEQELPSIRALKMVHESLGRINGTEHMVVNRFDPKNRGFAVDYLLKPLGVSSLTTVARDDAGMSAALENGCPLRLAAPQSPALTDIVALTETLLAVDSPARNMSFGLRGPWAAPSQTSHGRSISSRTVKILHVEDEVSQRRLIAHHLTTMDDFHFDILYADAEEGALDLFAAGGVELVILDYHLRQGNGLHCLVELRRRDEIVPIIAVSGVATPEIAADLLQAGADDYIGKRELTSGVLARRIRDALARADAWRQHNVEYRP